MEKTHNTEFESLLQNEQFIRLINESPVEGDLLVEDLCRENPGNAKSIRLAVQLLRRYHSDQPDIDDKEITIMWNNILTKSQAEKSVARFRIAPIWRIAASIALLVSFAFYCFEYSRNHSIRQFADKKVNISDEAKIVISDGSEYKLKTNDSHIRYHADGKEIIIEEKDNQREKLTNQPKETKIAYNQIIVPYGRRHGVTLSDGTVVQLNSGSTLIFPAKFSGSKREVYLKGEGYFEVAKNAKSPFVVNTKFINVKVLGTHFNISAYENELTASAVLVEGSVEIAENKLFTGAPSIIKPGQGCFFSGRSKGLTIEDVDVNEFISWKDGLLQFRNLPLRRLTEKVEKFYNKTISIEDQELANRIISGKLVLSSKIEETLVFLSRTTKSRYVLRDDGTYIFYKD